MNTGRYSGVWWLPEDPGRKLGGELYYSASGMQLELSGTLFDHTPGLMGLVDLQKHEVDYYPVILGGTRDVKKFTLVGNLTVGITGSSVPTQRIVPSRGFVGAHVGQEASLLWSRVKVSFEHLMEWFGETGIQAQAVGEKGSPGYQISYSRPTPLTALLDGAKVELTPGFNVTGRYGAHQLESFVHFDVQVDEPLPFDDLGERFVAPLQDLVTLGTGTGCPVNYVAVYSDAIVHPGSGEPVEVEVLNPSSRVGSSTGTQLFSPRMVFSAGVLSGKFQEALAAWFRARQRLETPASILFGSQYVSLGTTETEFLTMSQAVEVFHRLKFPGTDMPPEEHSARVAAILDSTTEEVREWLAEKLQYTNEPTFRRRLKELYDYAEPAIAPITRTKSSFVGSVVSARNLLVHEGTIPEQTSLEMLFRMTQALRFLLWACFIQELGFSNAEAAGMLGRNSTYNFLTGLPDSMKS